MREDCTVGTALLQWSLPTGDLAMPALEFDDVEAELPENNHVHLVGLAIAVTAQRVHPSPAPLIRESLADGRLRVGLAVVSMGPHDLPVA